MQWLVTLVALVAFTLGTWGLKDWGLTHQGAKSTQPGAGRGASTPTCAGCHPAIAKRFEASRHAVAWTNPLFQAEYGHSPKPWCVSCHAPTAFRSAPLKPPSKLADLGVSCLDCHLRTDGHGKSAAEQFTSRRRLPGSIHSTIEDPSFGTATDCVRCHQFNFPNLDEQGFLISFTDEPMQNTVAEAVAFGGEATSCVGCHDPHRAPGSHDPLMVAKALEVTLCRRGLFISLHIANLGAGHNVPTGGVHRYISASLWRSSSPRRMVSVRLGREFRKGRGANRVTSADTTLAPGTMRRLEIAKSELGGEPGEPINAEVRYHYSVTPGSTLADGTRAERVILSLRKTPDDLARCAEPQPLHP